MACRRTSDATDRGNDRDYFVGRTASPSHGKDGLPTDRGSDGVIRKDGLPVRPTAKTASRRWNMQGAFEPLAHFATAIYNCRGPCREATSGLARAGLADGASDERIDSGLCLRHENPAPGATPGRVGRCPSCGGELRVPDCSRSDGADSLQRRPTTAGQCLWPESEQERSRRSEEKTPPTFGHHAPARRASSSGNPHCQRPGGIFPALGKPETSAFASILYPLRSADSLAVMASLTVILWLFTILVPEYCIALMGDADDMGTPSSDG